MASLKIHGRATGHICGPTCDCQRASGQPLGLPEGVLGAPVTHSGPLGLPEGVLGSSVTHRAPEAAPQQAARAEPASSGPLGFPGLYGKGVALNG